MFNFIRSWLGVNPKLPFYWDVPAPMHGQAAKNHRHQKVIWDEAQGKWVMPQNFSDKPEVVID